MNKDIKTIFASKMFQGFVVGVLIFTVLLLVFQAGVFIGYRKASFSYRFGERYYKNAPGMQMHMRSFDEPIHGGFLNANGAVGKIASINLPTFVVIGPDSKEKIVLIKEDTKIRSFEEDINASELKVDDYVAVIGSPNDNAEVEAKLIRIMPMPMGGRF